MLFKWKLKELIERYVIETLEVGDNKSKKRQVRNSVSDWIDEQNDIEAPLSLDDIFKMFFVAAWNVVGISAAVFAITKYLT